MIQSKENSHENTHERLAGCKLTLRYFAILREQRGLSEEVLFTQASTAADLYAELAVCFSFTLPSANVRVAINDRFETMECILKDGDNIVFIPPVAGG